jgi:hypothetical protein
VDTPIRIEARIFERNARFRQRATGKLQQMVDPMYSTEADDDASKSGEAGGFERGNEFADRELKPGNAAAPGQRRSESGSTPSDIETHADEDAHRNHTVRRRPE